MFGWFRSKKKKGVAAPSGKVGAMAEVGATLIECCRSPTAGFDISLAFNLVGAVAGVTIARTRQTLGGEWLEELAGVVGLDKAETSRACAVALADRLIETDTLTSRILARVVVELMPTLDELVASYEAGEMLKLIGAMQALEVMCTHHRGDPEFARQKEELFKAALRRAAIIQNVEKFFSRSDDGTLVEYDVLRRSVK